MDVIARTAANDLLERLEWLTMKPEVIVVLGWGAGDLQKELQVKYPGVTVATELLQDKPVDMLLANLYLPWQPDYQSVLTSWQKYMRPEGVLLLSSLGPDTLQECAGILDCIPQCVDMHEMGDALASLGFSDPVMEVQQYTLEYSSLEKRWQELSAHSIWVEFSDQMDLPGNTLTFELVYGHAFCAAINKQLHNGSNTVISLDEMRAALSVATKSNK